LTAGVADCRTCELLERRDRGEAPDWDAIVRTDAWDVVHCDSTSLLGWIVLVLRRHVAAVADLTDDEAVELGPLVRRVSRALHDLWGCEKTYIVQFAEHPAHRHVHVHVIPRSTDLDEDRRGPGVFRFLGVPEAERVSEEDMDAFAVSLRRRLEADRPRSERVTSPT
jgi:diadenosine tetraphosphate (Ap4A) HIT family hydrolase